MDEAKRRLSAVWFADVVGYTTLSARDEPLALKLIGELQALARRIVEQEYEGRVVKFIGDAVLAEFGSTERAVRAAVALTESFEARATELGVDSRLHVGVHLGEVVATSDGDLYGDGINTAARLQHEAPPGQVIVSEDVWRQLRQRPEFQFQALGGVDLRGITTRVEIYNVLFGASAAIARSADRAPQTAPAAASKKAAGLAATLIAVVAAAAAGFWFAGSRQTAPAAPLTASTTPPTTGAVVATPPVTTPSVTTVTTTSTSTARPASTTTTTTTAAPPPAAAAPAATVAASPPAANPPGPVRALVEQFAAALTQADPLPPLRQIYPSGPMVQLRNFAGVREAFGPDLQTRFLRIENQGTENGALKIRFFILASSTTREPMPLAFEAAVVDRGGAPVFARVQRVFPGGGRGGRQ